MLSSSDVSQLIAAQTSQFAGQNYYATTIGISNPALSVGQVGAQRMGGNLQMPQMYPGIAPPPPVFSHAGGGMTTGYGGGNAFAGHMMSGFGGAATLGGVALGLGSMFGALKPLGPFLDPFSGFGAGRALFGGSMMGGVAGAALPIGLAMAAGAGVNSFVHGGQQQQMIAGQLGNFNFLNPMSRTGQGFSRQDAASIGESIRSLSHIPDMLTSVEELTRLLPKMRSMGVMQGARDVNEFQKRFKDAVTTIRDMSRVMGTTMEEASKFFESNRLMGFNTKQGQLQNTINAQFTSGLTGMTMGQTIDLQMSGASMARQFGARGRYGVAGVTNMAQRIQTSLEAGALDQETLTDVTGLTGPEAIQAGAGKMYNFMQGLSGTSAGRAIMFGAMKRDKNGRMVIDEDIVGRLNRGEIGLDTLKSRAGSLSGNDKISAMYNIKNLGAQFAGQVDFGKFMQGLVGNKGTDAAGLVLQQISGGQMSEADISMMLSMYKGTPGIDQENFKKIQSREMAIQKQTDPAEFFRRLKTKMHAGTFGQIEQWGASAYTQLGRIYDDFIDDVVGRHVVQLSKQGAATFQRAMMGGNNNELKQMFALASGFKGTTGPGPSAGGGFLTGIRQALYGGTGRTALEQAAYTHGQYGGDAGILGERARGNRSIPEQIERWRELSGAGGYGVAGLEEGGGDTYATGALHNVARRLARDTSYRKEGTSRRIEMLKEGMADVIASGIHGLAGMETSGIGTYKAALLRGDLTGLQEAAGGVSLEYLAEQLGDTDAGKLFRASLQASRAAEGRAGDFLTAGLTVTRQVQDALAADVVKNASQSEMLSSALNIKNLDQARKQAEYGLAESGISGDAQAVLRTNQKAAKVLNHMWTGKEGEAIRRALTELQPAEAAIEISKITGVPLTTDDIQDIDTVFEAAKDGKVDRDKLRGATGALVTVTAASDLFAYKDRISSGAQRILQRAQKGSAVAEFGKALAAHGGADSEAKWLSSAAAVREQGGKLAAEYARLTRKGASKTDLAAAEQMMSELGETGAAIRYASELQSRLGGGGTVSKKELLAAGLSETEIKQLVPELAGMEETKVSSSQVGALVDRVAASKALTNLAPQGAAQTRTELSVLESIEQNLTKQTQVLALVASGVGATKTSIDAAMNGTRENAGGKGEPTQTPPAVKPGETPPASPAVPPGQ